MEYLVTMTTRVPDGTTAAALVTALTPHPSDPGAPGRRPAWAAPTGADHG